MAKLLIKLGFVMIRQSTTDIWMASFLKFNGCDPIDFEVLNRGKGRYYFELTDEQWKEYRLKFLSSDLSKLKQIQEELKDLLY